MRQKIIRRASELGYVNPNAPQTTPTSGLDVCILIPENFFSVVSFYATFYKPLVQALTDAGHFGIMELVTHDMQTALTLPYEHLRWVLNDPEELDIKHLDVTSDTRAIEDMKGNPLLLFGSPWSINWAEQHNEALKLSEFGNLTF